ncbi:hypothetical protein D7294_19950 [Streptomyces hoynatensis]|uniref:Uncharacterized protein n=2 Tax=Streptomyces hoynatensis TaxID=1141874 RepID=A0A3A9YVC6_9ACTN|nr:hypothetical protein D7294_19950 [Streptomyces hoynatensis]
MPRVECPCCHRQIAAAPVSGAPRTGRLWRHDQPGTRRSEDGSLLSCPGSLHLVELPLPAREPGAAAAQLELPGAEAEFPPEGSRGQESQEGPGAAGTGPGPGRAEPGADAGLLF